MSQPSPAAPPVVAPPARAWLADASRLVAVVVQLGAILLIARAFHIENPAFYLKILPLAVVGFVINHLLPLGHRPTFFAALGITAIVLVFGIVPGLWLVGLGAVMIGLCHLPVPFPWRVAAVAVTGVGLMTLRAGWGSAPWPGAIWPIFGSMFMFRLAVYLYDLRYRGPAAPGLAVSYFFLLPNVVFPLFPIVDFHAFRRTYYDRNAYDIYDEGLRWIFRGLTHLVLYRLVYQYVALSPSSVESTAQVVQYLVGNYGLYLRVSGQFHVAIGILHLFGFRLPETHRFFYLASSFSDMWRRINIYWKDFMQKLVYLPVMFGLKRHSETTALVGATLAVVAVTWFLHSYQWFWLLGVWLFSATDAVFWGILGVFLMVNTLREQRRGRARQITVRAPSMGAGLRHALQTAGMFSLMCVLWGFWTSPSFEDFLVLVRAATLRPFDIAAIAGLVAAVAIAAFVVRRWSLDRPWELGGRPWSHHPMLTCALPLAIVWGLGEPQVAASLPLMAQQMLRDTRIAELNNYDAERLQRGYYEKIVGVNRFNGQLWEVYASAEKTREWAPLGELGAWVTRFDPLEAELRPLVGTVFKGGIFRTNRWGMRDREYAPIAPPATQRIAVLGQSYVMGSGVNDGEPFEAVIEDALNRDWSAKTGQRYELLNFAVPNYSMAQQAIILENGRVGAFKPQWVVLVGHTGDLRGLTDYVWKEVQAGRPLSDPAGQWVREADIQPGLSMLESTRRLRPREADLARWAFDRIAAAAGRLGARLVYTLIPMPTDRWNAADKSRLIEAARASGFTIIDLEDVYSGSDENSLILNLADRHPNTEGHRLIGSRLYAELVKLPGLLSDDQRRSSTPPGPSDRRP